MGKFEPKVALKETDAAPVELFELFELFDVVVLFVPAVLFELFEPAVLFELFVPAVLFELFDAVVLFEPVVLFELFELLALLSSAPEPPHAPHAVSPIASARPMVERVMLRADRRAVFNVCSFVESRMMCDAFGASNTRSEDRTQLEFGSGDNVARRFERRR